MTAPLTERRIQVVVEQDDDGGWQVALRLETLSPDLGWYPQKTLVLDPDELADVRRQLAAAERELRRHAPDDEDEDEDSEPGMLITFPRLAAST